MIFSAQSHLLALPHLHQTDGLVHEIPHHHVHVNAVETNLGELRRLDLSKFLYTSSANDF